MEEDRDETFPPEVMLRIFSCLSGKDLLTRVALTCKHWHGLTQDEHLWRSLCMRDVEGITLLSLLQPDPHKKEKDYTPTDLVLLRSRDAFLEAKPQECSWLWLWRAQNVRPKPGVPFRGIGFEAKGKASDSNSSDGHLPAWQYCGEWKDGKRHGYGKCIWPNGTWYHGRWENDTRKGQGKLVWRGGGYYVGEWLDGHQEGPGTLLTRNGFLFEGTWKKNELSGKGTKSWLENGKREAYTGEFQHTKAHGFGRREYGNGATYVGSYERDRRVGQGVFTWPCGHQFAGEWNVGRRKGRLICPDGREFEQVWAEAKMQVDALHAPNETEVTAPELKIGDGLKWLSK